MRLALTVLATLGLGIGALRSQTMPESETTDATTRVAAARNRSEAKIRERFRAAGVRYPAAHLFLRSFKREAALEMWAADAGERFRLVAAFAITKSSGAPGPKRREGDLQVPEGFYRIDAFNPQSLFHLSLRVNYPNASDRVRSDPEKPGFDIYIHGNEVSIGCLPLGDGTIEEVYLATLDAGNRDAIPIHIFPARMSGAAWREFADAEVARDPSLAGFWAELQPGFDAFERTRQVPTVSVTKDGRYRVSGE